MDKIFNFIFESLRDIFNFLDFSLPGISLTFIDFFLLVIIISTIFKLVKGAVGESGDGLLYSSMDSLIPKNKDRNISYKKYESYAEDRHMKSVRRNHDEQLNTRIKVRENKRKKR